MKDVETFLASPAISPSIEEISRALDSKFYTPDVQNPDQKLAPSEYDLTFKPASVLLPIWHSPTAGLQVLLTQRAKHMRNHPGQIAFPGGQMDATDATVIATALRETEEEVGLKPQNFNVIGQLGDYFTTSGFCVSPVIAEVTKLTPIMICYDEVESAYWVPLDYLLNPKNFKFEHRILADKPRGFFEVTYENIHIWGVTAGILYCLYQALTNEH
ncbi:MAG: CoA pyrophosphatase [Marinomonas sp.]|jgi:8-oxo-dGTP pyrophosphatase MutT (NUDIX family)|uniref:CoA pyrophosphatase n=1 Tax=unclassified Marinomonas TaxID=196814 RepID=UPI0005FA2882|nr:MULTISPECIES: CoA pyrophosphatase [unclassified Marinomonas]KJZ14454.1 NUDIX hydrolase [Marinomonas sp. S3726]KZM41481.1 NUDIX hydrolase [Marinomonas sp. SBI22]KZM43317.1 NUDIX hydrolase [Marinomonas sp. SBI8L]